MSTISTISTISNERLGAFILGSQPWNEEIEQMATELLALRKERERAEHIVKAAEKLVRCKGRYHSEQNYRTLAALFGVITPDLLPLETDTTSQQFESLAGKAVYGWIPCSERMPEIGEKVLMRISCNNQFNIESGKYKGDGLWLGCWCSTYGKAGSPYQVAHWMPLPSAPEPCK